MRRERGKWKRKVWLDERAMSRLLLWQQQLHRPRNRRETQHGECRGEDQGRGGSRCRMSSGRPGVRSAAVRHGPGCGGRAARGRDSAYSEAPGRHVSGSVTAVSPDRAPARRPPARSLHLLPVAAPQPVRNDAVSAAPSPRAWPGLRAGGGEADGVSAGGGGEHRTETSRGARAQVRRRRPHRGARGTEAEEREARDARGGSLALPRPPARCPPGLSAWVGGTARPQWGRPRCLAATGAPALQTAWTGRLPARKAQ